MAQYAFECHGRCLGDWAPAGSTMIVDTDAEIRPLDVVSIVLKLDSCGRWGDLLNSVGGDFVGVTKFYLGSYEAPAGKAYIVGQLTPPCVAIIPETAIEAMHRVIAVPGCAPGLSDEDREAFELIRPFGNNEATAPINAEWRNEFERAAA